MTFAARATRNLSNTNNFSVPANVASSPLVYWYDVAVNRAGLWVGVGYYSLVDFPYTVSFYATTSTDGANWVNGFAVSTTDNFRPQKLAVNLSGLFVTVGYQSGSTPNGLFSTSTDGVNWTTPTRFNGYTGNFTVIGVACSSSGRFVAIGYTSAGATLVTTSTDGVTWSTPATMAGYTSSAWYAQEVEVNSAGRWVAVGSLDFGGFPNSSPAFSTSTDGINWTTPSLFNAYYSSPLRVLCRDVAVNPDGKWVALMYQFQTNNPSTNATPMVSTSTNGTTWTTPTLVTGSIMYSTRIAVSPPTGLFVVQGVYPGDPPSYNNNYNMFMTSRDGTTWTTPAAMGGSTAASFYESLAISSQGLCVSIGRGTPGLGGGLGAAYGVFP